VAPGAPVANGFQPASGPKRAPNRASGEARYRSGRQKTRR
jgi:hypothetical protein